jgi:hypothetical protein
MYENRTTADVEETDAEADPATAANYGGTYGTQGVIVPPVITSDQSGGSEAGYGLGQLQELYFGGVEGLFGAFGDLASGVWGQNTQLIDILANGGSAPAAPTAQAPQTTAPVAVAHNSQPTTASRKSCADMFPNFPHHDGSKGKPSARSCYKTECEKGKSKKKRVHKIYKNGADQRTAQKCG